MAQYFRSSARRTSIFLMHEVVISKPVLEKKTVGSAPLALLGEKLGGIDFRLDLPAAETWTQR